jgi:hypothetical protein
LSVPFSNTLFWRIGQTEHVARKWERRNVDRILVGEPNGKCTLEKPGRWKDNIKTDVRELG